MIKTLTLSATVAAAAATLESVADINVVDEVASTKEPGIVAWPPFYQRYIN